MMRCFAAVLTILCLTTLHFSESSNEEIGRHTEITIPRLDYDQTDSGKFEHNSNRPKRDVSYTLAAFGKNLYVKLTSDSRFIAPNLLLLRHNLSQIVTSDVTDCFYSGHVNGEATSNVNVNLCDGMRGRLFYSGGNFLIEPHHEDTHIQTVHNKRHKIYRHISRHQGQSCGHQDGHGERFSINTTSQQVSLATETKAHSRTKRSYSHEHYVEIMVVADKKMFDYHGKKIEQYLLTLMSIVNNIYKHSSIGNHVNIVITKLYVIEREEDGPVISSNAAATLHDFCEWQSENNAEGDDHIYHHDAAVLLTKHDLCRTAVKCDTLGLAELGGLCDSTKSCSIIEDNGLSAAFTIAHELGHMFNLPHDDSKKCPHGGTKKAEYLNVMSPTLDFNSDPWTWSKCSSLYMTEFLDSGRGACLRDKPPVHKYDVKLSKASSFFPGEFYTADQQCQLVFGRQSSICKYMPKCARLWCSNLAYGCRTQHMPWADGTKCGSHKWCMKGKCVAKRARPNPIIGDWSPWQDWGPCSRECGGGIRASVRRCNNPPPNHGGKFCIGRRVRYKSCNLHECLAGTPTFREKQCSEFDGKHFNINGLTPGVRWVPKYAGVARQDRCKLYCRVSGSSTFYRLSAKVKDGTKCTPDTTNICVNGVCRHAGCDHQLGSDTKFDKCGVCGGDNSSCRLVEGSFNRQVQYGYNSVVTLPRGALNIEITQTAHNGKKEDDNYLALGVINMRTKSLDYILNGGFVVSMFSKDLVHHGVKMTYSGSNHVLETLNISRKLTDRLVVMVLSVGELNPPNIHYKYLISHGNDLPRHRPTLRRQPTPEQYQWDTGVGSWTECDKQCRGVRSRRVLCTRKSDNQQVSERLCQDKDKPEAETEKCNTECSISWNIVADPRAKCSVECGTGVKRQRVLCVKRSRRKAQILKDAECSEDKPSGEVACRGKCVPGEWKYSDWTSCPVTCGTGVARRQATCVNREGNKVDAGRCKQSKVVERSCVIPCPVWKKDGWSECSVTCGQGIAQRLVTCTFEGQKIEDKFCAGNRPTVEKVCDVGPCPSWRTGDWSKCGTTCGDGLHQRSVACWAADERELPDTACDKSLKPASLRSCLNNPCPVPTTLPTTVATTTVVPTKLEVERPLNQVVQWRTGGWTPCSSSCGVGVRARYVSCRTFDGRPAGPDKCANAPRPVSTEECMVTYCGKWRVGDWSQCSKSCGEGSETRLVGCIMVDRQRHEGHCDTKTRPDNERKCNLKPCAVVTRIHHNKITTNEVGGISRWRTGPWGSCSKTCGNGWQRRQVVCHDERGPSVKCDAEKPEEIQRCMTPCPVWSFGEWGQCTASCGEGMRRRAVLCREASGKNLPDSSCDTRLRPSSSEGCRERECPPVTYWYKGKWSKCSVSCGMGKRVRRVMCLNADNSTVEESLCRGSRPRSLRRCRKRACPQWVAGEWSQCSVSCGQGRKVRDIWCKSNGTVVNHELCSGEWPRNRDKCEMPQCPVGIWKVDKWSKCSITCGRGFRSRHVTCVNKATEETIADGNCKAKKPKTVKKCRKNWCPYMWRPGNWTRCSKTCGVGIQSRAVFCQAVTPEGWLLTPSLSTGCDETARPSGHRSCSMGDCDNKYFWRIGEWRQCSTECGWGKQRRNIYCMNKNGNRKAKARCDASKKPKNIQSCYSGHCYVKTCKELKLKNKINRDGDYRLMIKGKLLKVYCQQMKTAHPVEYLSLPAGKNKNFAHIYSKRLRNPYTCPYSGRALTSCGSCIKRLYPRSGYTVFKKVRLNVTTLEIIPDDFTFSTSSGFKKIPFGSGGDCYSAAECPQGGFRIDLTGTGFKVSKSIGWYSRGRKAVQRIRRLQDGVSVHGQCGGYCATCEPYMTSVIKLVLVDP